MVQMYILPFTYDFFQYKLFTSMKVAGPSLKMAIYCGRNIEKQQINKYVIYIVRQVRSEKSVCIGHLHGRFMILNLRILTPTIFLDIVFWLTRWIVFKMLVTYFIICSR